MTTPLRKKRSKVAGQGRPVTTFLPAWLLLFSATGAQADPGDRPEVSVKPFDPFATQNLGRSLGQNLIKAGRWNLSPAAAGLSEAARPGRVDAPAQELAEGLGVEITQNRRRFSARALNWIGARSSTMGRVADFFIGGGDSGWQLMVDPVDEDEYQLQWQARFR